MLQLFSVLFPVILDKYHGIKQKENAWCFKKWSTHFEHLLEQAFIFLKDPPTKVEEIILLVRCSWVTLKTQSRSLQVSLENLPKFEVCQTPFLSIL